MSEFKYACPVCGQHIKCDSSQAGTQMECPTCFQKITVPQAPASADSKFILTGTKVGGERPVPKVAEGGPGPVAERKSSLAGVLILLVLVGAAAAGVYAFRGKIFNHSAPPGNSSGPADQSDEGTGNPAPATQKVAQVARLVAPPANDTNWMMNLDAVTLPDAPVAGRIHGQDFIIERAILQNGMLTLRVGRSGPVAFGLQINFGNAQPETLAGQSLNIATNAPKAARVILVWQDGDQIIRDVLQGGYALRLNFGQIAGNRLPGQIYFCAPDETKSYVTGAFNAEIRRTKPKRQN